MCGDIELNATSTEEQYTEFNDRETKKRKEQAGSSRASAPKMFARPGIFLVYKDCIAWLNVCVYIFDHKYVNWEMDENGYEEQPHTHTAK